MNQLTLGLPACNYRALAKSKGRTMASQQEVAAYVSALIPELIEMCRRPALADLAFLLSVAGAEAQRLCPPIIEPAARGASAADAT